MSFEPDFLSAADQNATFGPLHGTAFHVHNEYFQANTIDGYGFFDVSGKIMNRYAKEYEVVTNGLEGLRLSKPKERDQLLYGIHVAPDRIWCRAIDPERPNALHDKIVSVTKDVARMLGNVSFSRLGFRTEYWAPAELESKYVRSFLMSVAGVVFMPEIDSLKGELSFDIAIKGSTNRLGRRMAMRTSKITRPALQRGDYPTDGIIVDIDIFRDSNASISDLDQFLSAASNERKQLFDSLLEGIAAQEQL